MKTDRTIRRNLRNLRLAKGWSQADLAKRSGIPSSQISNFECGERLPNIENLIKLKKALDCSYDDLLTEKKTDKTLLINILTKTTNKTKR